MSFLRHKGIFQSDELLSLREQLTIPCTSRSRSHRLDEFPVGYSWRAGLHQSPLPLRQPRLILWQRSVEGKGFFEPVSLWLNSVSQPRGASQSAPVGSQSYDSMV